MVDLIRGVLLTRRGRQALLVVYLVAAVASVTIYAIVRDPVYAIGVAIPLAFAPLWARWCLRRT